MTTFRGVMPLDPADSRYASGYRYVVATAEVTIGSGVIDDVNAAAGGAASGNCTLTSITYTVARTLVDGEAESEVVGTASPGSTESVTFKAVVAGRADGFRLCTFSKSLTPTGAPGSLPFHFVHFGLVGDVFIAGDSVEIDDGALTGPGGLQARYYANRSFTGLPVAEPVENIDLARSDPIPGSPDSEDFSARWVGYIRMPETGAYRFRMTSDGRGRVTLGTQMYIDNFEGNKRRVSTGPTKNYTASEDVFILFEMANPSLGYEAKLEWELPSTPGVFAIVPASVMYYGVNVTLPAARQEGALHYVQDVNRYTEV